MPTQSDVSPLKRPHRRKSASTDSRPLVSPAFGERWCEMLANSRAKGKRLVSAPQASTSKDTARSEVLTGFRNLSSTSRSVSNPVPGVPLRPRKRKLSTSSSSRPQRNRFGPHEITPIQGIFIVLEACNALEKFQNNSGVEVFTVSCATPTKKQKRDLVSQGYGRITSESDPLMLDPTLSAQETSARLEELFSAVAQVYRTHHRLSAKNPLPEDWCIMLRKSGKTLSNITGQVSLTTRQLLDNAYMSGGRVLTREIFLAVDAPLGGILQPELSRSSKGKGKQVEPDSESESEEEPYMVDDESDEPASPSPKRQKRVLRPRPRLRVPSLPSREPTPEPTPPATVSHGPSTTPILVSSPAATVIELDSNDGSDIDNTSAILSRVLSLQATDTVSPASVHRTVVGEDREPHRAAGMGVGEEGQGSLPFLSGLFDPFNNDYTI